MPLRIFTTQCYIKLVMLLDLLVLRVDQEIYRLQRWIYSELLLEHHLHLEPLPV